MVFAEGPGAERRKVQATSECSGILPSELRAEMEVNHLFPGPDFPRNTEKQ